MIVPRRADPHRDELWAYCRRHWETHLPEVDIVEGHHDTGPFNRSAAINAAAAGDWDVAVIVDADVILDAEDLRVAVASAFVTGRLTIPFRSRVSVSELGTAEILRGVGGTWAQWVIEEQTWNVSTCIVVPRALWGDVGGFDERFVGWGGEDEAFHAACLALGGGVTRVPSGHAWHLWHPPSPWKDHRSAEYRMVLGLSDRYVRTCDPRANRRRPDRIACADPAPMRRLLAEPRTPDQIVVVCLTNGTRPDLLEQTLASADASLSGPIGRRVLAADRRIPDVDGWDTVLIKGGRFDRATANATQVAIGSGQPWVFFLEDDFTFNEPVDLAAMQATMDAHPELVQMSLMRQPWYDHELAAGGVIPSLPQCGFTQRDGYVEHRAYWTQNPMLTRRSTYARYPWPLGADSERRYAQAVLTDPTSRAGIWGQLDNAPRVTHTGVRRASGVGH